MTIDEASNRNKFDLIIDATSSTDRWSSRYRWKWTNIHNTIFIQFIRSESPYSIQEQNTLFSNSIFANLLESRESVFLFEYTSSTNTDKHTLRRSLVQVQVHSLGSFRKVKDLPKKVYLLNLSASSKHPTCTPYINVTLETALKRS